MGMHLMTFFNIKNYIYIYVCVCVCVRTRAHEKENGFDVKLKSCLGCP